MLNPLLEGEKKPRQSQVCVRKCRRNHENCAEPRNPPERVRCSKAQGALHWLSKVNTILCIAIPGLTKHISWSTLQGVLDALKKLQSKPKGIRGRLKEVLYASGVADEISGLEKKIQELRLNFMVRQVHPFSGIMVNQIVARDESWYKSSSASTW